MIDTTDNDDDQIAGVTIGLLDVFLSTTLVFILISSLLWGIIAEAQRQAALATTELDATKKHSASALAVALARIKALEQEVALLNAEAERHRQQPIIIPNELNGNVLFDPGEATIRASFIPTLRTYTDQLLTAFNAGQFDSAVVAGHTDERHIHNWKYADNWDLGAARATAIVRYLIARGVPADRLSAASYGELHPLNAGRDESAWRMNRRIEIVMLHREGQWQSAR